MAKKMFYVIFLSAVLECTWMQNGCMAAATVNNNPRILDPSGWNISALNGGAVTNLTDNNPQTMTTLAPNGSNPAGLLIDLGASAVLNRIYLTGPTQKLAYWANNYDTRNNPPLGIIAAFVGDTPNTTNHVATFLVPFDGGNPIDIEAELRFRPVSGRYVRLEMHSASEYSNFYSGTNNWTPPSTLNSWNVGEIEISGYINPGSLVKQDAVVWPGYGTVSQSQLQPYGFTWSDVVSKLTANSWAESVSPTQMIMTVDVDLNINQITQVFGNAGIIPRLQESRDAVAALTFAADELSYYLSSLSGKPVPVITPSHANDYPGTLYTIVDLKPLAPDYNTMTANITAGSLPSGVNVEVQGRQVYFKAWPYVNVVKSVWEFLIHQGVRWVYPDAHGDYIPALNFVDLSILPLKYMPSASRIYANWDVGGFLPWPGWYPQTLRQEYLNVWRNGWESGWNSLAFASGSEIPHLPTTLNTLNPDYTEGFAGYPHNLSNVVPTRILLLHPDWWGYSATLGQRVNPTDPNAPTFDMSNPDLIQWVANKMVAVAQAQPETTLYNLLPMDAATFDQSTRSVNMNNPPDLETVPWVRLYSFSESGVFYNFMNEVAKQVKAQNPAITVGALAYADIWNPPLNINSLSANTQVEVCMYGAPNLLTNSPLNAALKQGFQTWLSKTSKLNTYDYALLHTDVWQPSPQIPVAMVSGIVDRAKFLNSIGALNGGTQATTESFPYDPWNYYAYPRIRVSVNQLADQILSDFFTGYFGEAAQPMLNYYKTMEDYQVQNNVNMHFMGYCYNVTPNSFPNEILATMNGYLAQAESAAQSWVVTNRVAKMREGYNWVLTKRGVTVPNLTNTANVQVVGQDNNPFILDLSKGLKADNGPVGNFAEVGTFNNIGPQWLFWAQGVLYETLNFVHGGTYKVKVTATAVPAQNIWPTMNVYVGPHVFTTDVTSGNGIYTDYTFNVDVPDGIGLLDFIISYSNAASGGARNLMIKSVSITFQNPIVNAGPDQTISLNNAAFLNGSATGGVSGGIINSSWTKISGPGNVTFSNATSTQTYATFSAAGDYVLRLSASDGSLVGTDDMTIRVMPLYTKVRVIAPPADEAHWLIVVKTNDSGVFYRTDLNTLLLPLRVQFPSGAKDLSLKQLVTDSTIFYALVESTFMAASDIGMVDGSTISVLSGTNTVSGVFETNMIQPSFGGKVSMNRTQVIIQPGNISLEGKVQILNLPDDDGRKKALTQKSLIALGADQDFSFLSSGTVSQATLKIGFDRSLLPPGSDPSHMKIAYFNPITKAWEIQENTTVVGDQLVSDVAHFSIYKPVLEFSAGTRLECFAFPNPAHSNRVTVRMFMRGLADSIDLTIYDISGRVVHSTHLTTAPSGVIDNNYYYDYGWNQSKGSGVYFAVVQGKHSDGSKVSAKTKFAVVK